MFFEIEVPIVHQLRFASSTREFAPVVGLKLELATAVEVSQVPANCPEVLAAARHDFDYHLGCPIDRARDEVDLFWRQASPAVGSRPSEPEEVQKRLAPVATNERPRHAPPPSSSRSRPVAPRNGPEGPPRPSASPRRHPRP